MQPDCTLAGHPEVFAVGDMVSLNNLPGVAQPAMQEGKYVGKLIAARLAGDEKAEPFKYFDKGSMATIGHRSAIADAFGMQFTGVHRVHDVGLHPRAVPDRLGQPDRHDLHVGPRAHVLAQPRAPDHHVRRRAQVRPGSRGERAATDVRRRAAADPAAVPMAP